MNAALGIKAMKQDCVGGVILAREFESGIVDDDVTVVLDAKLAAYLQDDFRFVLAYCPYCLHAG